MAPMVHAQWFLQGADSRVFDMVVVRLACLATDVNTHTNWSKIENWQGKRSKNLLCKFSKMFCEELTKSNRLVFRIASAQPLNI